MVETSKNKVVKNTIILYLRMIVTMIVSIYTSRVILQYLGIDDFGVYGVIGGVVGLFSFLSRSLTVAFNRFLCVSIAKDDIIRTNKIIGAAVIIQIVIIIVALIACESIGVWFINNYLVISPEKLSAAHIVFQFSILTFIITIFTSAYNSIIISYEKMSAYAYICIFEVVAKLAIVYALVLTPNYKLEYYSAYICLIQFLTLLIYCLYVKYTFKFIKASFKNIRKIISEMLVFSGYGFLGNFAFVAKNQGINFLLNIYGGPVLNAARSISFQVYTAVYNFVTNFQTAFSPYLMKKQESESERACNIDVSIFTHLSFTIMGIISIPILFFTNWILHIWLGDNVPLYTSVFTKYILLIGMFEAISSPLQNIIFGKGEIKWLQILVLVVQTIVVFLAFYMLKLGRKPSIVYLIDLIGNSALFFIRLYIAKIYTALKIRYYLKNTLFPILCVSIVILYIYFVSPEKFIDRFFSTVISELLIILLFVVCLPGNIRQILRGKLKKNFR